MTLDKQQKRKYLIELYSPEWPTKFEQIKSVLQGIFATKALSIEHVGSTSVPGMESKPVIDILITVNNIKDIGDEERGKMSNLGYKYDENYIAPRTIIFIKDIDNDIKTENIHVCEKDSPKAKLFILSRDFMRTHPDKAREYSDLKRHLYMQFPNDYPAYRTGKRDFLNSLMITAYIESLKIKIENPAGTYKSFHIDEDPTWAKYPLAGVTYPVDYGYIEGYRGEDGAELDIFVGTGDLSGFIKVWRIDVKEETKFFKNLSQEELDKVLKEFSPVILAHEIINDPQRLLEEITKFAV